MERKAEDLIQLREIAEKHGHTPAQVSLAWLLGKPGITSPVVGVSRLRWNSTAYEPAGRVA